MNKEAILWTACERPEYAKVSLESIFTSENRPEDFYAYVDRDSRGKSTEIVKLLESYNVKNIIHREVNLRMSYNTLYALRDLFEKDYSIVHGFEEDIIVSRGFFLKSREVLSNSSISIFCGCVVEKEQINKIYSQYSPWGVSIKKEVYDLFSPHIDTYLKLLKEGVNKVYQYQLEHFGFENSAELDGLIQGVVKKNNLLVQYPERSYCKDIGVYGFHRKIGTPPIKTLEEWANTPPEDVSGYGINGINFQL